MADIPEFLRTSLEGRYELERELGVGGMATVYLGRDLQYDRAVAIKVLKQELATAVGRHRFLLEIEIAARLSHPHILPLFHADESGGLLYYVMPYVEGESLKDRIHREKQLPVRDAVAIAREVAAALDYAHARGIVHRDVKPGNILLSAGTAVVADFGIARAVRRATTDETITDAALAIGTPPYMSPEQWSATRDLDARSDVYSLGCVVYEMLAGQPPFTGSTTEAIAARVAVDPVPPLRTVRPRVSPALERAILTALEKVPADRFATAGEFAEALAAAPLDDTGPVPVPPPPVRRRWAVAAAGGIALAAVLLGVILDVFDPGAAASDTTLYAVLPFRYEQGTSPANEDQSLQDALRRWGGVSVVDPFLVRDAVGRSAGGDLSATRALGVARQVKAGRYIRAQVSREGDSLRVRGFAYDATLGGARLHDATVTLPAERGGAAERLTALADSLLFRGTEPPRHRESFAGTSSYPARQAYAAGHRAIEQWDLDEADAAFSAATTYDPQYAQAYLWLAQVRAWRDQPAATWRSPAERASAGRDRLAEADRRMTDALLAIGRADFATACRAWRDLTRSGPADFVAWYGLGNCLAMDEAVIRDRRSPSGWGFRASYHEAARAYRRAYQLLPSVHRALSSGSYQSVQALLKTSASMLRKGRALPPDTGTFEAYASWLGDTLAFVPYAHAGRPATTALAVTHQREQFHEVALAWVAAFPTSDDAMLALALALEMLGDPAARDTMRRAAALATAPSARVRITAAEVWMRVRAALPDDLAGLAVARDLADSLLRANPSPGAPEPIALASLAALLGQADRAAGYMRQTSVRADWTIPGPIARSAAPLLVYAALGGPEDSLRALERDLATAIERSVPQAQQRVQRAMWLGRAASLAFPGYRFATLQNLAGLGDYLVDAQAAFARGDRTAPARMADSITAVRRTIPPEQRTLDSVYPEAALLAESGDTAAAILWLEPTLSGVASMAPGLFDDPTRAASLVRGMAFRAELAAATGDTPTARRWARAVMQTLPNADEFLLATVARMRRLAE
jgi:hypothetical protein